MELVEGETLRTRLRAGRLLLRDAIDIAVQVARALGAAHEKGIVHRDIKPENVMIRRDGYVKVLDFGLAILRAREHETQSMLTDGSLETVMAAVAGTPAYMSPEQIDGRALDARSDLFSLGVLLCEMTTGTNPFAGSGVVDTISAIQHTPDPAARLTADLTHDARAIILKLLQRDPANRYQASSELVTDLRRVLGTIEVPARARAPSLGRRRGVAIAAGLALLAAAGTAAVLYRGSERRHWVHEQAIPEVVKLAAEDKGVEAFRLIEEAEKVRARRSRPRSRRCLGHSRGHCALDSSRCARRGRGLPLTDEHVASAGDYAARQHSDYQRATCDGRSRSLASAS